jgi:hypothetical protein
MPWEEDGALDKPPIAVGEVKGGWEEEEAPVTPKSVSQNLTELRDGIPRAAISGATMGFADEAIAGLASGAAHLRAPFTGETVPADFYDKNLSVLRKQEKDFATQHPWADFMSRFGGAAVGPGKVMSMAQPTTMLGKIGTGAGLGGVEGMLTGFGSGEGSDDRIDKATQGAILGTGIGAAAPPVISAAGYAGLKFSDLVRHMKQLAMKSDFDPAARDALDALQARMQKDGITVQDLMSSSAKASPETSLADLLDPRSETFDLVKQAAEVNVPESRAAIQRLLERDAGTKDRVVQAIRDAMGSNADDFLKTHDTLLAKKATEAEADYAAAYQFGVVQDDFINAVLATPAGKDALKQALTNLENSVTRDAAGNIIKRKLPQITTTDPQGNIVVKDAHDVQALDDIKQSLDDILSRNRRPDGSYATPHSMKPIESLRDQLRDRLAEIVPEYKTALSKYAGTAAEIDAMNLGRNFRNMDPDVIAKEFNKMSPSQKKSFQLGAVKSLESYMRDNVRSHNIGSDLGRNEAILKRMREITGPNKVKDLENRLMDESRMHQSSNLLRSRGYSSEDGSSLYDSIDPLIHGASGNYKTALGSMAETAFRRLQGLNDKTMGKISQFMMDPQYTTKLNFMDALENSRARREMINNFKRNLATRGTAGALSAGVDYEE